jgi:hypothetical protein
VIETNALTAIVALVRLILFVGVAVRLFSPFLLATH